MNFKQFIEMPLASYKVAPFIKQDPNPGTAKITFDHLHSGDRRLIQSGRTYEALERVLKTSTKYDFNIILIEYDPNYIKKSNIPRNRFLSQVQDYCQQENIPLEGRITFAKNSSTGDPLTPWMILHTMGHALYEKEDARSLESILREMLDHYNDSGGNDSNSIINFYTQVFKFRSARINPRKIKYNDKLTMPELCYEIVAEYLWHGYIRAKHDDPEFDTMALTMKLKENINDKLARAVGRIIADFYIPTP